MGKDRDGKREKDMDDRDETIERAEEDENKVNGDKKHVKSKRKMEHGSDSESDSRGRESSGSEEERRRRRSKRRRSNSRRRSRGRYSDEESDSYSGSSSYESDSEYSVTDASETEEERRRRKRKERKKREEREKDKERKKRRKEKERKRGRRGEEDEKRRKKKKEKEKKKKDKEKKGAVTNSWGKYGTIREVDMWNKRPEFTAWLLEVKEVNLESLANWEEKKMFKEFMEDYNTATLPSKKYYNLDYYHKKQMHKQMKKGLKHVGETERTVFNDEEQRRLELMRQREKDKQKEIEALKNAMQSGMAQDMKEQARLKEEMQYLYKVGNYEAAAVIQRKLDPDVAM